MTPLVGMPSMRASRVFIVIQDEQGKTESWARGSLESFSFESERIGRRTFGGEDMSVPGPTTATFRVGWIEMYEGPPPLDFGRMKPKEMPLSPERVRRMALGEEEV